MTNNRDISDPDFRFPSSSTHHIFTNIASSSSCPDPNHYINRNPKKKRSKVVKVDDGNSNNISKQKITKKPDPSAPKITRPCTECGKKFWSWKALFGHMRCHPEREWRGINPPPNARRSVSNLDSPATPVKDVVQRNRMTVEDHEVASCLLMLANGANYVNVSVGADSGSETDSFLLLGGANSKFECSSCKKVFGSHQALGGHRASHKNVKGCFAITKNEGCEIDYQELDEGENDIDHNSDSGHKCNICLKVFSSGQALGGHKRCHWEKGEEEDKPLMIMTSNYNQGPDFVDARLRTGKEGGNLALDLNRPAPIEDDSFSVSSSYSTGLTLDLRLGL